MLQVEVPGRELYDEASNEFIVTKPIVLRLEHSLVSISKWESKWKIPFLSRKGRTREETRDYIRCMTLNQNVDPNVYLCLTDENISKVAEYIGDEMTATTFNDEGARQSREVVTSELIYYWMVAYNIPMECQKWHLSRLMTLIRICSIKNSPPKKMSKRAVMNRNARLNAARRKKLGTKG